MNRMSSSDPFQELVDSLKRVLLHPSSSPVCPAPAPPQPSPTPSTSSPIVFASPMADQRPSLVRRRSAMASYYKFLSPLTCIRRCFPLTNLKSPFWLPPWQVLHSNGLKQSLIKQVPPPRHSLIHCPFPGSLLQLTRGFFRGRTTVSTTPGHDAHTSIFYQVQNPGGCQQMEWAIPPNSLPSRA